MRTSVLIVSYLSVILVGTSACRIPGDSELIEGILQNVDELNGEMTVVTKDGETVTIKITKDTLIDKENEKANGTGAKVGSTVKLETDKKNVVARKTVPVRTIDDALTNILPSLESVEDVFNALGVGEKAATLHDSGLTWAYVARQLGFNNVSSQLQKLARERLAQAVNDGSITEAQSDILFQRFNELAKKWNRVIFLEVEERPSKENKNAPQK